MFLLIIEKITASQGSAFIESDFRIRALVLPSKDSSALESLIRINVMQRSRPL